MTHQKPNKNNTFFQVFLVKREEDDEIKGKKKIVHETEHEREEKVGNTEVIQNNKYVAINERFGMGEFMAHALRIASVRQSRISVFCFSSPFLYPTVKSRE